MPCQALPAAFPIELLTLTCLPPLLQMYPTRTRAFALGVNNALSRVGAMLAPFLAVDLAERGRADVAEGVIAGMCALAAAAVLFLPRDTSGKLLTVRPLSSPCSIIQP